MNDPTRPYDDSRPLPTSTILAWATGAFGVAVLMNGISALILFYLTVVVKLNPAVAGFLVLLSRLYDAISDPLSGYITDRTRSKMGRRRPWLLGGAFVSAGAFLMVFTMPFEGPYDSVTSGPGLAAAAYVLFALIVYTTGYSMFNVAYMAMPAEMTEGYHERSRIHAWRVMFSALGGFAVTLMLGVLLERFGKDRDGHAILGAVGAVVIFVSMLTAFFGTRGAPSHPRSEAQVPLREQLAGFLRNKPFQLVLAVKLVQLIGLSAGTGGLVFLFVNVLHRPLTLLSLVGGATVAAVLLGSHLLVWLSRRVGKRGGYMIAAAINGVAALSWSLATADEPLWMLVVRGALLGIAFSGNVLFAMSMLTDAMEIDFYRTGLRREGMYSALYSFVEKLATSVGPMILGGALAYAGFNPKAPPTVVDEGVRQAVLLGIAYVPAAMSVLAVVILSFYKLDEPTLAAIRAERSAGSAPVAGALPPIATAAPAARG